MDSPFISAEAQANRREITVRPAPLTATTLMYRAHLSTLSRSVF